MKFALIAAVATASAKQKLNPGIPPIGMSFEEPLRPVDVNCPDYDHSGDLGDF